MLRILISLSLFLLSSSLFSNQITLDFTKSKAAENGEKIDNFTVSKQLQESVNREKIVVQAVRGKFNSATNLVNAFIIDQPLWIRKGKASFRIELPILSGVSFEPYSITLSTIAIKQNKLSVIKKALLEVSLSLIKNGEVIWNGKSAVSPNRSKFGQLDANFNLPQLSFTSEDEFVIQAVIYRLPTSKGPAFLAGVQSFSIDANVVQNDTPLAAKPKAPISPTAISKIDKIEAKPQPKLPAKKEIPEKKPQSTSASIEKEVPLKENKKTVAPSKKESKAVQDKVPAASEEEPSSSILYLGIGIAVLLLIIAIVVLALRAKAAANKASIPHKPTFRE